MPAGISEHFACPKILPAARNIRSSMPGASGGKALLTCFYDRKSLLALGKGRSYSQFRQVVRIALLEKINGRKNTPEEKGTVAHWLVFPRAAF